MISKIGLVKQVILWLVLAVCLGEFYHLAQLFFSFEPAVNAGLVSTILAVPLGFFFWFKGTFRYAFTLSNIQKKWWLVVLSPVLAAVLMSLITGGRINWDLTDVVQYWSFIFWIPIVEEILYRGVISTWLRSKSSWLLGSYGSSMIFCLMHVNFTWRSVPSLDLFVPIGPLLLAWSAEYIYMKTGRLWLCIAFHASCNATAVVFQVLDPRWLHWLSALYL